MAKPKLIEKCVYTCGPYKGYCGRAELDTDDRTFGGRVIGLRDVVTFEADTPLELGKAFRDSVDDYLAFCEERKESPDKPMSGKFVARIEPEVHKALASMAEVAGKSLNQLVSEQLALLAETGAAPTANAKATRPEKPKSARRSQTAVSQKRRAAPLKPRAKR